MLIAEASDQHQALARVRKVTVRLHRQLATQRSLIHRFEREMERLPQASLQFATAKLAQRLDWLDHEMIALRDRAHLLQEEVSLNMADQTNRNLQLLAIVTTVFLPASLIAAIFGMNVAGLPLTPIVRPDLPGPSCCSSRVSALVFWLLKRSGILGGASRLWLLHRAAKLPRDKARRERIQHEQRAKDRRLDHAALPRSTPCTIAFGAAPPS